jgi:tight adherence protein C
VEDRPELLSLLVFLGTTGLALVILVLVRGGDRDKGSRLQRLLGLAPAQDDSASLRDNMAAALPRLAGPLLPGDEQGRTRLQQQFMNAGLYGQSVPRVFAGVRTVVLGIAVVAGLILGFAGPLSGLLNILAGAALMLAGLLGPEVWLRLRIRRRQKALRRALPDLLDIVTLCLESGLGLPDAFARTIDDLQSIHPILTLDLAILQREAMLGLPPGQAFSRFADRCGLPEARILATALLHAERLGVGVSRSLRMQADMLRQEQRQQAEELAQQASVKLLFPMLLFIFPAIFIVVLAPAIVGILNILSTKR